MHARTKRNARKRTQRENLPTPRRKPVRHALRSHRSHTLALSLHQGAARVGASVGSGSGSAACSGSGNAKGKLHIFEAYINIFKLLRQRRAARGRRKQTDEGQRARELARKRG